MIAEPKPLHEITKGAIRVLYREIGLVDTVRFLSQFSTGYGNYTEERRQIFADMTLDDIISAMKDSKTN